MSRLLRSFLLVIVIAEKIHLKDTMWEITFQYSIDILLNYKQVKYFFATR